MNNLKLSAAFKTLVTILLLLGISTMIASFPILFFVLIMLVLVGLLYKNFLEIEQAEKNKNL